MKGIEGEIGTCQVQPDRYFTLGDDVSSHLLIFSFHFPWIILNNQIIKL